MNFLVTGGAGFIGSHLCEYLSVNNHNIVIVDDLSSGSTENVQHLQNVNFKYDKIQKIETKELTNIAGIFHLAAQASVPVSLDEFYQSSSNNLQSSIKVFSLARKLSIPVIYASSSAIYGNLPCGDDEKEEYEILSPYAQDKLTLEHYAKMCWNVFQVPSIGLRFFNVYGPRQDPKNPYSGVISIFIDRLLNNNPVTVNGGYQTRDFIYVKDISKVIFQSMNFIADNPCCDFFNLGTGNSITIDNLLKIISSILKIEPKIDLKELPAGDPEKSSGTYDKLQQTLAIDISKFYTLKDGLSVTIEHIKKDLLN